MPALIFDLDGTLVDTVYAHVFAWQRALNERGLDIDRWRIHRRIGMSGGLFTRAVARELGRELTEHETAEVQDRHGEQFRTLLPDRRALPGAVELLADLRALGTVHGIATSGRRPEIDGSLEVLGVPAEMARRLRARPAHRPRRRVPRARPRPARGLAGSMCASRCRGCARCPR